MEHLVGCPVRRLGAVRVSFTCREGRCIGQTGSPAVKRFLGSLFIPPLVCFCGLLGTSLCQHQLSLVLKRESEG